MDICPQNPTISENLQPLRTSEHGGGEDTISIASLEDIPFKDGRPSVERNLQKSIRIRKAGETVASMMSALNPQLDATDVVKHYLELKDLVNLRGTNGDEMSRGATVVLVSQSLEGKDLDLICEKYEMVLTQGLQDFEKFAHRIGQLKLLRENVRRDYQKNMEGHFTSFLNRGKAEEAKSAAEEKEIKKQEKLVSDENRLNKKLKQYRGMLCSFKKRRR